MVTRETTFEELREQKVITLACLDATIQQGWKNLGEMMCSTGTVEGLRNISFQNRRIRSELINALDRLPAMDRALVDWLLIRWDGVEPLEREFDERAAKDAIGKEVKRCFHSAWELRTLALYDQDALDKRLSDYLPLTQKQMIEWAIDCFDELELVSRIIPYSCSNISGLGEAEEELKRVARRFCFVHDKRPFPEWDDFALIEFQELTYEIHCGQLRTAMKDPSFVERLIGSVYLPKETFCEKMAQSIGKRTAQRVLYQLIPQLIDRMLEWELASRDEQIAHMASHVMGATLNKAEKPILCELRQRLGYMPLFFLACALLGHKYDDKDFVFAVTNGIIEDPENKMAEIRANKFYSDWLIRSWSKGKIREYTIKDLNRWDWSVYPELNEVFFLFEENPLWQRIREEERVTCTFEGFGALLSLTHGLVLQKVGDRRLLVNQRKLPGFNMAVYAKELDRVLKGSYTETVQMDLRELAGESAAPLPLDELIRLTTWLTGRVFKDGRIVLSRNRVDVEQLFVRYLQEKGEPMSKQELLERYRKEYPDIELSDSVLLGKLSKNPRFIMKKMAGLYGLSEWKAQFHSTINDLAEQILRKNGEPMSIEELHTWVVKEFTTTSQRSMEGCLRVDPQKRFVKLPNRRIGLAKKSK